MQGTQLSQQKFRKNNIVNFNTFNFCIILLENIIMDSLSILLKILLKIFCCSRNF